MSAAETQAAILTREELAALFEGAGREAQERKPLREAALADPGPGRAELTAVAERFAEEHARSLSTLHQTPIQIRFSHCEEIKLRHFASAMLQTDRIACLDLGSGEVDCYLLLNRPLVFGWMMLSFGAPPGSCDELVPTRSYTRIEERFLKRASTDFAQTFAKALGNHTAKGRFASLINPVSLYDKGKRTYVVASFEVDGLGDLCRMRLALPNSLLDDTAESPSAPPPSGQMADQLLDMPVELRVQIGFAEVSLSEVATLQPGDELRLTRLANDSLVVQVEDLPKYHAEPGCAGGRLAVRITEVLQS